MGYGGIFGQKTILDAFTKEQTLSNATAALYGYSNSGSVVPDNLFATLSKAALYYSTPTPKYQEVTVNLSTAQEGDIIQLIEGGKAVDFYVAKLNYESALNGSGRTLIVRKDVYDQRQWNSSNVNTWATSIIRSWLNNAYKGLLDSSIQAVMGTTTYRFTPGDVDMNVTTRSDAVFLLSVTELGLSNNYANVEGSALYIAPTLRIAYQNGSSTTQWTRSPWIGTTEDVWYINPNGTISNGREPSYSYGSRPVFTLPQDFTLTFYVDNDGNVYNEQEYEAVGSITDVQGNPITIGTQIATGSYTGTGTKGPSGASSLVLPFAPKMVIVANVLFLTQGIGGKYLGYDGYVSNIVTTSEGDKTITWYVNNTTTTNYEQYQCNTAGVTYNYIALG